MSEVTYIALSPAELERIVKDATKQDEFIRERTALARYDISKPMLQRLTREGVVKKYAVPGLPKTVRYKVTELDNAFKPIQS